MKRIFLFLLCCLFLAPAAFGQGITSGTRWFNGSSQFEATRNADGSILMYSMNEGQESEFLLVPLEGKPNQYCMKETDNDGAIQPNEEELASTVKSMRQDGRSVLAVYNAAGKLIDLYSRTARNIEVNVVERWLDSHKGTYALGAPVTDNGADPRRKIVIGDRTFTVDGQTVPYRIETINGYPLDVITIQGTSWNGSWHLIFTDSGFNVYPTKADEYGYFDDDEEAQPLDIWWADPEKGRWDFLSEDFNTWLYFSKPTLRLMRNSILAKYGYEFQSEDLKAYFAAQPWYSPAGDNASIKTSFIEQMNIALIQGQEAIPDADRYIREERPGLKGDH